MYDVNDFPFDGWIGVDLDGTLATSTDSIDTIGAPIPEMAERLLRWHRSGIKVKIFTARASTPKQVPLIRAWLADNQLPDLEITNVKDQSMWEVWDDKAVEVIRDTGRPANILRRITSPTYAGI